MDQEKLMKLKRFNMIMGGLHFIQGIMMLFFLASNIIQKIAEFQPTITQNYLAFAQGQGLVLQSKELFDLPFGILVTSFLLISALAHALISFPKKLNETYNKDLQKGINKFR